MNFEKLKNVLLLCAFVSCPFPATPIDTPGLHIHLVNINAILIFNKLENPCLSHPGSGYLVNERMGFGTKCAHHLAAARVRHPVVAVAIFLHLQEVSTALALEEGATAPLPRIATECASCVAAHLSCAH